MADIDDVDEVCVRGLSCGMIQGFSCEAKSSRLVKVNINLIMSYARFLELAKLFEDDYELNLDKTPKGD